METKKDPEKGNLITNKENELLIEKRVIVFISEIKKEIEYYNNKINKARGINKMIKINEFLIFLNEQKKEIIGNLQMISEGKAKKDLNNYLKELDNLSKEIKKEGEKGIKKIEKDIQTKKYPFKK